MDNYEKFIVWKDREWKKLISGSIVVLTSYQCRLIDNSFMREYLDMNSIAYHKRYKNQKRIYDYLKHKILQSEV